MMGAGCAFENLRHRWKDFFHRCTDYEFTESLKRLYVGCGDVIKELLGVILEISRLRTIRQKIRNVYVAY